MQLEEEEMEVEAVGGTSGVCDRVWSILGDLRAMRLHGDWEDAVMEEEEERGGQQRDDGDDDETVASALQASIGDPSGFARIVGLLWSELAALLDMPLVYPAAEMSALRPGLVAFITGLGYKVGESDLESVDGRMRVLELLIAELQASRIGVFTMEPHKLAKKAKAVSDASFIEAGQSIFDICAILDQPSPTHGVAALKSACDRVSELLVSLPAGHLGTPLLKQLNLTPDQMDKLKKMNECFLEEYRVRREVLVKRMDVTLHAMSCSKKHQEHESEVLDVVEISRQALGKQNAFGIYDILAARDDLTRLYPTPDISALATVKRLLIGSVPDRGGRVGEKRKDGAMPAMRERHASLEAQGGPRSRGKGRGRGNGRQGGHRVQGGGWDEGATGERRQRNKGGGGGWGGQRGRGRGGRGRGSA